MSYLRAKSPRRAIIIPLVAVSLVAVLAITGLVIDGGLLMKERRHAQNAADAAALAAAVDLLNFKGLPQAVRSAYEHADLNGYHTNRVNWNFVPTGNSISATLTVDDATVSVNVPPLSGPYKGNPEYVEVTATRRLKTFFIQVVGISQSQTSARAVAGVKRHPASPFGMIALGKSGNGVQINGLGGFTIQAPVITFSPDPNSLTLGGHPTATSTFPVPGRGWYTNGGYNSIDIISWTDGSLIKAGGTWNPTPSKIPSTVPISDPLITLATPPRDGLTTNPAVNLTGGQSLTIYPGIYVGGIKVTGNSTLTLNPGLYFIDGGGVQIGSFTGTGDALRPVSTDSSAMIANGVTFYNGGTASTFGPFLLSYYGTKSVVTPPPQLPPGTPLDWTKGYPGMSLYQDRDNPGIAWLFNQVTPMSGTYYASSGTLRFNGQGINPANPVQLIAGRIIIDTDTPGGNAESDIPYDAKVFAPPPEIYLVE